ncbi:hypothetical protein HK1_02439 [Tepidibacillus sp. HK-1]|nr:hypothetical protein HK1_02439 [Tepidibacillus sp. HK-1]
MDEQLREQIAAFRYSLNAPIKLYMMLQFKKEHHSQYTQ